MSKLQKRLALVIVVILLILTGFIIYLGSGSRYGNSQTGNGTYNPAQNSNSGTGTNNSVPAYRNQGQNTASYTNAGGNGSKAIAKVGDEVIYQSELDRELAGYVSQDDAARKFLLNKIITDSKILQIGQKQGYLSLDKSIFNAPSINYDKRMETVNSINTDLKNDSGNITGTIVFIWFMNDWIGPNGYDKSQQIALSKITTLYDAVKSGRLTIHTAATQIISDSSLGELDKNYKTNASLDFDVAPGDKITWEPDFDTALKQLSVGGLTGIFLGKSNDPVNTSLKRPAYYMFGQVAGHPANPRIPDLKNWLISQEKNYAVTYY